MHDRRHPNRRSSRIPARRRSPSPQAPLRRHPPRKHPPQRRTGPSTSSMHDRRHPNRRSSRIPARRRSPSPQAPLRRHPPRKHPPQRRTGPTTKVTTLSPHAGLPRASHRHDARRASQRTQSVHLRRANTRHNAVRGPPQRSPHSPHTPVYPAPATGTMPGAHPSAHNPFTSGTPYQTTPYRCKLVCCSLHSLVAEAGSKSHAIVVAAWFTFRRGLRGRLTPVVSYVPSACV